MSPGQRTQHDDLIRMPGGLSSSYVLTTEPTAIVTLSLPLTHETHEGIYEVVFWIPKDSARLNCCVSYKELFTHREGIDLQNVVVGLGAVDLKKIGKGTMCMGGFRFSEFDPEY